MHTSPLSVACIRWKNTYSFETVPPTLVRGNSTSLNVITDSNEAVLQPSQFHVYLLRKGQYAYDTCGSFTSTNCVTSDIGCYSSVGEWRSILFVIDLLEVMHSEVSLKDYFWITNGFTWHHRQGLSEDNASIRVKMRRSIHLLNRNEFCWRGWDTEFDANWFSVYWPMYPRDGQSYDMSMQCDVNASHKHESGTVRTTSMKLLLFLISTGVGYLETNPLLRKQSARQSWTCERRCTTNRVEYRTTGDTCTCIISCFFANNYV